MNLTLVRKVFTNKSTIGDLLVNDVLECYICEDAVRDHKIPGMTAIPYGKYKIVVTKSDRFSRMAGHDVYLPLFLNVPDFEGVRIHSGNKPEDTEGCLLPGTVIGKDSVGNSRTAFINLNDKINAALKKGEKVWITITK
jgi:Steigviridae/Suoliviridae L,D-carboxypeptidase/transpeptidase